MADHWEIARVGPEAARYRGPEGEAELDVAPAVYGGQVAVRRGVPVVSVWSGSLRWVGARQGEPMAEAERDRILAAVREHYRSSGTPFELVHASGEVEDEGGQRKPGFKSPLPRAEHSDGWTLEDLWLSPEYPDADVYPPTIVYSDDTGTAEIPRSIEVADGVRRRVVDGTAVRWIGARAGEGVTADERARILARVRSAYDRWGEGYRLT